MIPGHPSTAVLINTCKLTGSAIKTHPLPASLNNPRSHKNWPPDWLLFKSVFSLTDSASHRDCTATLDLANFYAPTVAVQMRHLSISNKDTAICACTFC
jgi:hypothetical protein